MTTQLISQLGRSDGAILGARYLAVLTISLQGAPLISQAIIALMLDPAVMGQVRTLETTVSVLVLATGLSAPSLAVREVAANPDPAKQAEIVRNLAILPVIGVVVLAVFAAMLFAIGDILPNSTAIIAASAWALIGLININRLMGGLAQGLGETRRVSLAIFLTSCVAVGAHVLGAWRSGFEGWIAGRIGGEIIVVAGFALVLGPVMRLMFGIRDMNWRALSQMIHGAIVLNIAFAARMAVDAAPLLLLVFLHQADASAGQLGVATLLLTLAILPVAIVTQFALPRLSRQHARVASYSGTEPSLPLLSLAIGVAGGITLAVGVQLLNMIWPREYGEAFGLATLLALAVPLRALVTAYGTKFLASGSYGTLFIINVFELVLVSALCVFSDSAWTSAFALLSGSIMSALILGVIDYRRAESFRGHTLG